MRCVLIMLIATICWCFQLSMARADHCGLDAGLPVIDAVPPYIDAKGSVTSPLALEYNRKSIGKLVHHLRHLASYVEGNNNICVAGLLSSWANNELFLNGIDTHAKKRHRIRVVTALNLAALSLVNRGYPLDEKTSRWLDQLTTMVMVDFSIRPKRPGISNLQIWATVAVAISLLRSHNSYFSIHQEIVWQTALVQLSPRGYSFRELERGKRALLYHQYHYSALLMLAAVRSELGHHIKPHELSVLAKMADRIIDGICSPVKFVQMAPKKIPKQMSPNPNSFKIMHVFASEKNKQRLQTCGQNIRRYTDSFFLGDIRNLPRLLSKKID